MTGHDALQQIIQLVLYLQLQAANLLQNGPDGGDSAQLLDTVLSVVLLLVTAGALALFFLSGVRHVRESLRNTQRAAALAKATDAVELLNQRQPQTPTSPAASQSGVS